MTLVWLKEFPQRLNLPAVKTQAAIKNAHSCGRFVFYSTTIKKITNLFTGFVSYFGVLNETALVICRAHRMHWHGLFL